MPTLPRTLTSGVAALAITGGAAVPAVASAANARPAVAAHAAVQTLKISAAKSGSLMFSTKTLKAKAGKIKIEFTNNSPESHSFTLSANGKRIAGTGIFDHGTRTITVTLKKGSYTYYCSVPGHRAAGMQGTLKVS